MYIKTVIFNYLTIIVNIATGFILFPLILNTLGYEALGTFGIFFSLKSILDVGIVWISSGITKNLIKYKHLRESIFFTSKLLNIIFGLFSLIFFLIYGKISGNLLISILFSIGNFISFLLNPYYELFISDLKQAQVAYFRFLQYFLFFSFSIPLFLFSYKLEFIFLGIICANMITFFFVYKFYIKNFQTLRKIKFIIPIIKKIFINEKSILFNALSTILLLQVDILLISYFYGEKSAGIYLIISKVPNTLIMLGWRLSEPFQAIVAKEIKVNKKAVFSKFKKLEKIILIVSISFSLFYLFLGRYILKIWIGENNIPDIPYMYLIPSIVIIFSIMQRLYLSVNYYTKGLDIVTLLQFIEIIFKILFIFFFFKYFHELSPIVGWLVAFLFTIFFYRKNALKLLQNFN